MCLGFVCLCVFVCSTEVLQDVTFTVEAGQTVALVGCENRQKHKISNEKHYWMLCLALYSLSSQLINGPLAISF